jgi:hypothetical protein
VSAWTFPALFPAVQISDSDRSKSGVKSKAGDGISIAFIGSMKTWGCGILLVCAISSGCNETIYSNYSDVGGPSASPPPLTSEQLKSIQTTWVDPDSTYFSGFDLSEIQLDSEVSGVISKDGVPCDAHVLLENLNPGLRILVSGISLHGELAAACVSPPFNATPEQIAAAQAACLQAHIEATHEADLQCSNVSLAYNVTVLSNSLVICPVGGGSCVFLKQGSLSVQSQPSDSNTGDPS